MSGYVPVAAGGPRTRARTSSPQEASPAHPAPRGARPRTAPRAPRPREGLDAEGSTSEDIREKLKAAEAENARLLQQTKDLLKSKTEAAAWGGLGRGRPRAPAPARDR